MSGPASWWRPGMGTKVLCGRCRDEGGRSTALGAVWPRPDGWIWGSWDGRDEVLLVAGALPETLQAHCSRHRDGWIATAELTAAHGSRVFVTFNAGRFGRSSD